MSAVTKLLARFDSVKETSSGWLVRCPAHEDRQPSLSIGVGDDGRVLLKCHAGCGHKKIVAALGLEERDLFDADATPTTKKKSSSSKPATKASKAYTFVSQAQEAYERTLGKPTRSWEYRDPVTLEPVGRVLRWDLPEGEKEIRPLSLHADGWRLEHMVEPRPLYGVEFLEDADRVYVVEGEKCCDALFLEGGLGLASTTSSGGSSSAKQTDWSPLAGREVVILPDNDDPGRKYAADVAAILHELNPPAIVRVVELDGLDKGGDVADLYEACRDEEELKALRKKIERLAGETEPLKPKATPATPSTSSTSSSVEAWRPFPTSALTKVAASLVEESARAIGCDEAFVSLPLLAVLTLDDPAPAATATVLHRPGIDPLTGLGDSLRRDDALAGAIARSRRTGHALAVLHCRPRDPQQPLRGDLPLAEIGRRMVDELRDTDVVCRVGDDLFVVAEHLGDEQDAAGVAYRLMSTLIAPADDGGTDLKVSLTVGISVADGAASPKAMLEAAGDAFDDARADGMGSFRIVDLRTGRAA
jgi:GGDEF domain-containing protein